MRVSQGNSVKNYEWRTDDHDKVGQGSKSIAGVHLVQHVNPVIRDKRKSLSESSF